MGFAQRDGVLIKRAETAIETKNYPGALRILDAILAKQPKNAAALTQKARVLFFQGKSEAALALADDAIAADPSISVAYNLRGLLKGRLGRDINDALADFDRAIELDAKNHKAWMNRGSLYWDAGKTDRAMADTNRAIELDRNFAPAYGLRSFIYLQQTKLITDPTYALAKADAEKALSLDPKLWRPLVVRGYLKLDKRDKPGALADFLAAYEASGSSPELDNIFLRKDFGGIDDKALAKVYKSMLTRFKARYEKDMSIRKNLDQVDSLYRAIPKTIRSTYFGIEDSYEGYLKSLLASHPNDLCANLEYLGQQYRGIDSKEEVLKQFEAEVTRLLAVNYPKAYRSCAAELASRSAQAHFRIASQYWTSPNFDEHVDKSIAWAKKANSIIYQYANENLARLGELIDRLAKERKENFIETPANRKVFQKKFERFISQKGRISIARVTVPADF
ncbi:MAG: tetratricopeptide repeat protein [Pyrinomonadaceae bacterium]